ncbi:Vacuolar assembly protein [Pleurostoma richardsiae]|uniref:Vacuolar assembly protein n=1 Tax=Pleurostoma richardsiae TaxID=41990 RepID=A0AA38RTA2_9PEZI|nr:Vacuolar assembly protein [Pleurostoma richardsiae]
MSDESLDGGDDGDGGASKSPATAHQTVPPRTQEPDAPGEQESRSQPGVAAQGGDSRDDEGDDDAENEEEEDDGDDDDDEDEDEDEDEEPRLKYARLTSHLGSVYRNGDATSTFLVAGDKMIIGTHNGNIHVVQLPIFQALRVYHAHSATVTSVSIFPYPPPLPGIRSDVATRATTQAAAASPLRPESRQSTSAPSATSRRPREPPAIPNTPSNNIYIATSSLDGNVCVQSLVDIKDVQLRNFARPVQAVALSPDYRNDRTYLSGGLAGNLILTVGGQPGRSTSTTVGTAAAAASGWLGSMGLGTNTGKDTILHSGEGTISTIKWSLSGKYVAWLNEHGIKIMRTKLHLESADAEDAWKRIGHIDRPQTEEWDTMAGVWKGRAEWIDEQAVESEDGEPELREAAASLATEKLKQTQEKSMKRIERLLVGWGGTIWIIHVHPGGVGVGKNAGERSVGRAEIVNILRMDCIISGISLYTQNLLLVLAYCLPDDDEDEEDSGGKAPARGHRSKASTASSSSEPPGGIQRRQNNQPPELRLIDLASQAEIDKDSLSVSRYERLSSNDYHLALLPQNAASAAASSRGALEALAGLGTDMWRAAINPVSLFNSGASIRSGGSGEGGSSTRVASTSGSVKASQRSPPAVHPNLIKPGVKIFIHSPYDCILATKRDLADHLAWLIERHDYQQAWELLDEHPEIANTTEKADIAGPSTPDRSQATQSSDDFYEDNASTIDATSKAFNSTAEKEKRRIGGLWIQQLIEAGDWTRAAQVAGKVLTSSDRWEKCIWTFASANRFDEIANYIPTEPMHPPIPGTVYEIVLGHYIQTDRVRFRELLDRWGPELYDLNTVTTALENLLKYREVREDSVEGGEKGRDWRIIIESLAKLHEANGRNREALKCYIKLQDADCAMRLIRDGHLADTVADDIPSFIALRVPPGQAGRMTLPELEEATSEAITLLVDEAQHGLVKPEVVVSQLQEKNLNLYLFFYLRALWRGDGIEEHMGENRERLVSESKSLVDEFADLAVHLFAMYDQSILMDFLKTSTSYAFEKAAQECEDHNYIPELVYLYSKTGQMKRALYLIIDRLGDVSQAISFAKEQDDPDLWEDLLNYSMDKPRFIRALLEEVGTAIDPITLVRRIPEGLEIEGLREGLKHIMKEHEIQYSISEGVARVLRSEVAAAQNILRNGQRKGVKFEVVVQGGDHIDVEVQDVPAVDEAGQDPARLGDGQTQPGADGLATADDPSQKQKATRSKGWKPGHCARCYEPFTEWETETLVGFTCGHIFHLTHLLEFLHPGEPPDVDFAFGEEERPRRNIIGTKVTHARLLRDRIAGGCPYREAEFCLKHAADSVGGGLVAVCS